MNKATMKDYLDKAKSLGIRNLLALRGGIKRLTLSRGVLPSNL
jgi:5,10-methylenetetrahydrofolate reductase